MFACCDEPTMDDLLAEDVTRLLMKRDGIEEVVLRDLMAGMKQALGDRPVFVLPQECCLCA